MRDAEVGREKCKRNSKNKSKWGCMKNEDERRARAAEIMQDIRERRAAKNARKKRGRAAKVEVDAFEQTKVKMMMRIYGVSSGEAQKIVASRAAESAAREVENKVKRARRVKRFHRRVRACEDDEWIPASEIFCDA